jgi:hypothetical protein
LDLVGDRDDATSRGVAGEGEEENLELLDGV